jgi:hypothetical protein
LASDETSRFTQGNTRHQKIRNVKIKERFKDELLSNKIGFYQHDARMLTEFQSKVLNIKLRGKNREQDKEQGQNNGLGKVSNNRGIDEETEGLTHGTCN